MSRAMSSAIRPTVETADVEQGATPCLGGIESGRYLTSDHLAEIAVQLGVELGVETPAAEQGPPEARDE
jgi:hypothetical protein